MKNIFVPMIILACLLPAAASAQDLAIGDPAPDIQASEWVKGDPVEALAPDQTYVVECWATWCPPCRSSIPHLTELAHRFTNVTFIGMNIWERGSNPAQKVKEFVEGMGDKMDYTVAMDTTNGHMAKAWMDAAGCNGIPSAFIVHDGRIAWIGHPMSMEAALESVTDGSFDFDAARKAAENATDAASVQRKILGLMRQYLSAAREGNDEKTAELAGQIEEKDIDNPMLLNYLAWEILTGQGIQNRDLPLATSLAKKALELSKEKDANILDTYARALWDGGEKDQAIEYQKKAMELAPSNPAFAATLETYQEDLLPGGPPLRLQTERFGMPVVALDNAVYVISGHTDSGLTGALERFEAGAKTTEVLPASADHRRYHAAAAHDGKIYIAGGDLLRSGSMTLDAGTKNFEEYDPATGQTRQLPDMPVGVSRLGMAVVGDKLYVIGGADSNGTRSAAVQIYDFDTGTWSRGTDMPVAREGQVFACNDLIYVPGGYDGITAIRDFQLYDPAKDTWSERPKLPVKASAFQGIVVNGTLYLFGDYDELNRVVACDLGSGEWKRVDLPYRPARHACAAQLGDDVFVVGGNVQSGPPYLSRIQQFTIQELADASRSEWKPVEPAVQQAKKASCGSGKRFMRISKKQLNPEIFQLKWEKKIERLDRPTYSQNRLLWCIPPRHILMAAKDHLLVYKASDGTLAHDIPLPDELIPENEQIPNHAEYIYTQDGDGGFVYGRRTLYELTRDTPNGKSWSGAGTEFMCFTETGEPLWLIEDNNNSQQGTLFALPVDATHELLVISDWQQLKIMDSHRNVLMEQSLNGMDQWIFREAPEGEGVELLRINRDSISCYKLALPAADDDGPAQNSTNPTRDVNQQ